MSLRFQIKGLDGIIKALELLPKRTGRKAMTKVMKGGLVNMRTMARNNAPVSNRSSRGTLKRSIGIWAPRKRSEFIYEATLGVRTKGKNNGWYAHFSEYGTADKRQEVLVKPPRGRQAQNRNQMIAMKRGQKPIRFMNRTFDSGKQRAVKSILELSWQIIAAEARKLNKVDTSREFR